MAEGYEGNIALFEQYEGWGSSGFLTPGIRVLEPDSMTPDIGLVQTRRGNKMRGQRNVPVSAITNDYANPVAEFVYQPRVLDLLPVLMSHFQCVEVVDRDETPADMATTVSGTFRFAHANRTPNSVGSHWGTWSSPDEFGGGDSEFTFDANDAYPMHCQFGYGVMIGGMGDSVFRYYDGYAETLAWEQAFDGDLMITPSVNFKGIPPIGQTGVGFGSNANFGTNVSPDALRFSGFNGTITVDGTSNAALDIENFSLNLNNAGRGRGRIGQYGFGRFTFGDSEQTGGISLEFKHHDLYNKVLEAGTFDITMRWEINDQDDWLQVQMPNCKFRPVTPANTGGEASIDIDYEFEASEVAGTPAVIVSAYTEYLFHLLSIDVPDGYGTARTQTS